MPTFRYHTNGRWFKGNTHIHSVASDGGKTFPELARMYSAEGFDFLFRTDHWVASDVAADPLDYPLLWLDGIELDGSDYTNAYFHVVCLGVDAASDGAFARARGFVAALEEARRQGALLVLAHPYWTGNTLEDALRWGFDGVEVYNHVCHWLNGKGAGGTHWNWLLERRPATLGFASDDAHVRSDEPSWNGGWVMVNAAACTRPAILDALRSGNYYSTQGPQFYSIELNGSQVAVTCSPARFMRLVGPGFLGTRLQGGNGPNIDAATFELPTDWQYAYLEIEDAQGRRAWTNTLTLAAA